MDNEAVFEEQIVASIEEVPIVEEPIQDSPPIIQMDESRTNTDAMVEAAENGEPYESGPTEASTAVPPKRSSGKFAVNRNYNHQRDSRQTSVLSETAQKLLKENRLLAEAAYAALREDPLPEAPEFIPNTLHLRAYGYLPASTKDVFAYFSPRPTRVSWLNGTSLNVTFATPEIASRHYESFQPIPVIPDIPSVPANSGWRVSLRPFIKQETDKYAPRGSETTVYFRFAAVSDTKEVHKRTRGANSQGTFSEGGLFSHQEVYQRRKILEKASDNWEADKLDAAPLTAIGSVPLIVKKTVTIKSPPSVIPTSEGIESSGATSMDSEGLNTTITLSEPQTREEYVVKRGRMIDTLALSAASTLTKQLRAQEAAAAGRDGLSSLISSIPGASPSNPTEFLKSARLTVQVGESGHRRATAGAVVVRNIPVGRKRANASASNDSSDHTGVEGVDHSRVININLKRGGVITVVKAARPSEDQSMITSDHEAQMELDESEQRHEEREREYVELMGDRTKRRFVSSQLGDEKQGSGGLSGLEGVFDRLEAAKSQAARIFEEQSKDSALDPAVSSNVDTIDVMATAKEDFDDI